MCCQTCDAHSGECRWLGRVSAKAHLASQTHQNPVKSLAEREATRKRRCVEAERVAALEVHLKKMPSNLVSERRLQGLDGDAPHWHVPYDFQDLYLTHAREPIVFSAGDEDEAARREQHQRDEIVKKAEALLTGDNPIWDEDDSTDDDDFVSNVSEILRDMSRFESIKSSPFSLIFVVCGPDLPDSDDEELDIQAAMKEATDRNWEPYPNKTVGSDP